MESIFIQIKEAIVSPMAAAVIRSIFLFVLGVASARYLGRGLEQMLTPKAGHQLAAFARRVTAYTCICLGSVMALRHLGFDLTALLGAAGILTVAFGFAAQTSAANLISGLFLMGERCFGVGDAIRVGQTTGEVLSIDMLSVKLRTFDNLLVRLPNEMLVKSEIINLSHFPIRRIDLILHLRFQQDITSIHELLLQIAEDNPSCLDEPKPLFAIKGQNEYSIQAQFSVWTSNPNFLRVKTEVWKAIQQAFSDAEIEFAQGFPKISPP